MRKDEIARIRRELGLSQYELAELLNVDVRTVGRWEAGQVEPRAQVVTMLECFARALDARAACVGNLRATMRCFGAPFATYLLLDAVFGNFPKS